jgi:hypothetical protein
MTATYVQRSLNVLNVVSIDTSMTKRLMHTLCGTLRLYDMNGP